MAGYKVDSLTFAIDGLCIDCQGMSSDRVRGHLGSLLLAVLAAGPAHGYALSRELRTRTDGALAVPEGSLYPALRRLEEAELVSSVWDESASRRRRLYSLTTTGKKALADEIDAWRSFRSAIDSILEHAP